MIKIAIRDDDTNFFTDSDDLLNVYSEINDVPISLAVIPYVSGDNGECPESKNIGQDKFYIDKNIELVKFLKEMVKTGRYEILLHGMTHEYKNICSVKTPEMINRAKDVNLCSDVLKAKKYLEVLFSCSISTFVAPNNAITTSGVNAVVNAGMNFSGIITYKKDRTLSIPYFKNYIVRWIFRIFEGVQYPGVLDYKTHFEINACSIYSYEYLIKMYSICKRKNLPLVINTHYWHPRDNPEIRSHVSMFIRYAIDDGAVPATISECIQCD